MADSNLKIMCRVLCARERTGWIAPQLASGLVQWSHDPRIETWDYDNIIGHSTSQSARNEAAKQFLESDCNYLMMIDNDTKPMDPATGKLLNYVDLAAAGLPIVAAPMPVIKGYDWHLNAYAVQGKAWRPMSVNEIHGKGPEELASGMEHPSPVRCDAVGFGAVCIQRVVVSSLLESTWTWSDAKTRVQCEPGIAIRRTRDEAGGTLMGEDLLFCHRAYAEANTCYACFVLPHLQSGHLHTMDFADMHKTKYAYISPVDLGVTGPFPDMDAFTIELGLAAWLKEEIEKGTFSRVIELGSGLSTLVMGSALVPVLESQLVALEDVPAHRDKIAGMVRANGLLNVSILLGDYRQGEAASRLAGWEESCDLLFVDGPRATEDNPKVRQCAGFYFQFLTPDAHIVMDDADREGEAAIIKEWVDSGEVSPKIKRLGRAAIMRKI